MNNRKITDSKSRIKEIMEYYKINQTELCKRTGLQKSALSNYLSGDREPRQDQISLIADPFCINPAWLMGYNVPMFIVPTPDPSPASPVAPVRLRRDELELLDKYNLLNDDGKREVKNHTDYIVSQDRFLKDSEIAEKVG